MALTVSPHPHKVLQAATASKLLACLVSTLSPPLQQLAQPSRFQAPASSFWMCWAPILSSAAPLFATGLSHLLPAMQPLPLPPRLWSSTAWRTFVVHSYPYQPLPRQSPTCILWACESLRPTCTLLTPPPGSIQKIPCAPVFNRIRRLPDNTC